MRIAAEMEQKLRAALAPVLLQVIDESESHRGHAGWRAGGESHFRVVLMSPALRGLSRVECHRAVHAALGPELIGRIHALALELKAE